MITDPSAPGFVAATQVNTLFGSVIAPTITGFTEHTWVADSSGLFHTSTNLQAEWVSLRARLLAGDTTLTAVQHAEANAEAVFENTKLATLSAADQQRDREDTQREYDAIGAAMLFQGIGAHTPFTTETYLAVEQTLRSTPVLQELAIQGHGINNTPLAKYNGYTNDFQNNVDRTTLFVGQGLDNNQNALASFFDDVTITHLCYVTVTQNGALVQLNQNGAAEQIIQEAAGAANDQFFLRAFQDSEFSQTPGTASATANIALTVPSGIDSPSTMVTRFGDRISLTQTVNTGLTAAHTWVADSSTKLFTTTADLASEWQSNYNLLQSGKGSTLTAIQRLEANAQAVFLNTGIANQSAANIARYRMDAQRVFDANALAMKAIGYSGFGFINEAQYIAVENALRSNAAALELYEQGFGIQKPGAVRYNGYLADFANIDTKTLIVNIAESLSNGERAVTEYFGTNILGYLADGITPQNGEVLQLDYNGQKSSTVQEAIEGFNYTTQFDVLKATNFVIPGNLPDLQTTMMANTVTTIFGVPVANKITIGNHVWTADPTTQLFHVDVDLTAEWQKDYNFMLAGAGSYLSAFQRWAGNAEAAFENTALAKLPAAIQERDREDVQREIDVVWLSTVQLGIDMTKPLSAANYVDIERWIQANPLLQELGMQGHGLNSPSMLKYNGYTNDFQRNVDSSTKYVGGGTENGQNALRDFFDDVIMTHLVYQTVSQNGTIIQLNQNADNEGAVGVSLAETNDTLFRRVYVASDFNKSATAVGEVRFISDAAATLADGTNPVAGAGQISTYYGDVINNYIVGNAAAGMSHNWVADANGLFHTSADLTLEWSIYYQFAQAGGALAASLNDIQRLEANAQAVFLNTGLKNLSEAQQAIDREDAQREFDALGAAMVKAGLGLNSLFTSSTYQLLERTLQADHTLLELAMQGHGLNGLNSTNSSAAFITRYRGYTNDFQHNVDNNTLYIGTGLDSGERAIADFFDDTILSHILFPTVAINGELVQLNQNANNENKLAQSVLAANAAMSKVYKASDFAIEGAQPAPLVSAGPGVTSITTLGGQVIAPTVTITLSPYVTHVWVASDNGLFQTKTDLGLEWRQNYQVMLQGRGASLTAIQRLEGNAEAVFENTGLTKWWSASQTAMARADLQRQFDAMAAAMTIDKSFGYDPTAAFTRGSYMAMEQTIQNNATLYELALQGHGLNYGPSSRYSGYINDVQWRVDNSTYFVGSGFDNNTLAVQGLLNDGIMTNIVYGTAWQNGQLVQLDQWANAAGTVDQIVTQLNLSAFYYTYTSADFSQTKGTPAPAATSAEGIAYATDVAAYNAELAAAAPSGFIKTLYDQTIANTVTINTGLTATHVWTADATGLFHTATDLGTEWRGIYQTMLAGGGASLTAIQRLEGNAEAVFENTAIAAIKPSFVQGYREDLQRCFDAMADAMARNASAFGISTTANFTANTLQRLERTLQGNATDVELWNQGMGLTAPSSARYNGYLKDVIAVYSGSATYTGAGVGSSKDAIRSLVTDTLLADVGYQTVWWNGQLVQLDRNGYRVATLETAAADLNQGAFTGLYKGANFKRWW